MGRVILFFFGTFVVSGLTTYYGLSLLFPPDYVSEQDTIEWMEEEVKEMENVTDDINIE